MKINKSENPPFLNDYLTHLSVVKFLAEGTVAGYYRDVRQFLRYCRYSQIKDPRTPEELDAVRLDDMTVAELQSIGLRDIYDYFNFSKEVCGCGARVINRKASSLRSFFHYLTRQAMLLDSDPTLNLELKAPRPGLPKYLNLDESLRLLREITEQGDNPFQLRDYCMLTLFLNCGIRLAELVGLNLNSIDMQECRMRVLGKGRKERIVYLNPACMSALREYLFQRQGIETDDPALFLSNRKTRITRRRVQQVVENSLKAAGLDGRGLSTHKLRHTAATLMYQHGSVDVLTLKTILGHESISTTEIYTHLSDAAVREAMDHSPLAEVKRKKLPEK